MVPPKYKFYVFKSLSGSINRGYVVNDTTGVVSSGYDTAHSVTQLLSVAGYDDVRILTTLYNSCYLCEYDKDNAFIGKKSLSKSTGGLTLNSNTAFIRLQFYILNEGLTDSSNIVIGGSLVNPHYKELNKKYAKENGQEFFRITLDGKITLFGDDYELINNASIEDNLLFVIDKLNRITNKWAEYYRGEFNKTGCKLDYEKKSCEIKTSPLDQYTQVMNKYDNTYDLIKLAPAISKINLHKRALMQVYVRGANSISNFLGGTYWEDDVNEVVDSHSDLITKYYFSYVKAGNEFYVSGAGISDVNGVYAGTNGSWQKWYGYRGQLTKVINYGDNALYSEENVPIVYAIQSKSSRKAAINQETYTYMESIYKFQIIRTSDSAVLYESEWQFYINTTDIDADNIYIGRDDIKMINKSNSSDVFTLTNVFVYHVYQRLLCDVDTVEDSEGVKETYDIPTDDFVFDNRNYKKCIGLRGGLFFCTSRTSTEPTKYGMNDYGEYFTSDFIAATMGVGRPLPISRNFWANASLWYVYDFWYEYFEEGLRKQYTLKDSYSVGAAIKALLKKIDPSLTHEETAEYSRFLYDTSVPISMARFYPHITPKTNILKGDYDQAAQKAEITFEELMNMLRDCFRCYWYIEDGKFKVEHISFFMNGGSYSYQTNYQLDFTKLKDQFNKKLSAYFQSSIEFDKSELNSRYELNWMDDVTDLMGNVTLDINANYVQKDKTEEVNVSQFTSDIDLMLLDPSSFSEDGFALLCPISEPDVLYSAASVSMSGSVVDYHYKTLFTTYDNSIKRIAISIGSIVSDNTTAIVQLCVIKSDNTYLLRSSLFGNDSKELDIQGEYSKIQLRFYPGVPSSNSSFTYTVSDVKLCKGPNKLKLPILSVSLQDENENTYDALVQNWYASWSYLVRLYQYDLPAYYAKCNTLGLLYSSDIKKCMKHSIEFHSEEDLNELQLIKTSIGNGKIESVSINLNTRLAKVNLMYEPK